MNWLLLLASYLIGAIPSSYIVARAVRGIDLREHGSGNLGATNAYRVLGWKAATPIFIADIAKGWFPACFFVRWDHMTAPEWALAYGAAAIVGHVWSIYVGLRGGKGVATSAGVFLALAPIPILIALIVWGVIVFATGYVSLASIVAAAAMPILVFFVQGNGPVFWLACVLGVFVLFVHRANIGRLMKGEEHRFGRKARTT